MFFKQSGYKPRSNSTSSQGAASATDGKPKEEATVQMPVEPTQQSRRRVSDLPSCPSHDLYKTATGNRDKDQKLDEDVHALRLPMMTLQPFLVSMPTAHSSEATLVSRSSKHSILYSFMQYPAPLY